MDQPMMSFDGLNITSITGIITVTFLLVEVLKRFFVTNKGFGKIPVWIFAVAISAGLTAVANKVLHTENGTPLLTGSLTTLMVRSVLAAASASGFFSWLNSSTSIAQAQPMLASPAPTTQVTESTTTTQVTAPKDVTVAKA